MSQSPDPIFEAKYGICGLENMRRGSEMFLTEWKRRSKALLRMFKNPRGGRWMVLK
jgi:hypothetical protein